MEANPDLQYDMAKDKLATDIEESHHAMAHNFMSERPQVQKSKTGGFFDQRIGGTTRNLQPRLFMRNGSDFYDQRTTTAKPQTTASKVSVKN